MLNDLLRVKKIKEHNAHREEQKRSAALIQKKVEFTKAVDDHKTYHQWRIGEEKRLYSNIMGEPVALNALEDINQTVALHRQKDTALEQHIVDCQQQCEHAQEQLTQACRKRQEAQKIVDKYVQLTEHEQEQKDINIRLREDAELEEFIVKSDCKLTAEHSISEGRTL